MAKNPVEKQENFINEDCAAKQKFSPKILDVSFSLTFLVFIRQFQYYYSALKMYGRSFLIKRNIPVKCSRYVKGKEMRMKE